MAPPTREHSDSTARRRRRAGRQMAAARLHAARGRWAGALRRQPRRDGTRHSSRGLSELLPRLLAWRNGFRMEPGWVEDPVLRRRTGDTGQIDLYVVAADGTTQERTRHVRVRFRVRRHVVTGRNEDRLHRRRAIRARVPDGRQCGRSRTRTAIDRRIRLLPDAAVVAGRNDDRRSYARSGSANLGSLTARLGPSGRSSRMRPPRLEDDTPGSADIWSFERVLP